MKKKLFIGAGILILVAVVGLLGFLKYTKSHSPVAQANYVNEKGLKIEINYCKPYKKGRLIFGDKLENALQPYGQYWRVGANEATTFDVNQDIVFNGKAVKAGKYQLYAVPGKDTWHVFLNREWNRWGAKEADHKTDVLETEVPADNNASFEEQLIISFDQKDSTGNTNLLIHWDKTLIKIPVVGIPAS